MKSLKLLSVSMGMLFSTAIFAENVETLQVDVIQYEDFLQGHSQVLDQMRKALGEKGIIGIKSVPGYKEAASRFIDQAIEFSSLPESSKQIYAPDRDAGDVLGFEKGQERFKRPDGSWVVDDSKASYYALIPNSNENKWPVECDLETAFVEIGQLMFQTAKQVIEGIGLVESGSHLSEGLIGVGRMLHYSKQSDLTMSNPYWCGAHFDHGLFTALLPAFYFVDGKNVSEPIEAGLYVRINEKEPFKKVVLDDLDVMLFQVGEFGQLLSNDSIRATEHRVQKAYGGIERYTLALFIVPTMETTIHSYSDLTKDSRYGAPAGSPCSYGHWHDASLNRYRVVP